VEAFNHAGYCGAGAFSTGGNHLGGLCLTDQRPPLPGVLMDALSTGHWGEAFDHYHSNSAYCQRSGEVCGVQAGHVRYPQRRQTLVGYSVFSIGRIRVLHVIYVRGLHWMLG
jgi:hypothetical protein